MFLFILESIGTSELILIGIVALIFLGPRRLPEIARKIGKITAEFRSTANEFKETWRREVDLDPTPTRQLGGGAHFVAFAALCTCADHFLYSGASCWNASGAATSRKRSTPAVTVRILARS